MLLVSLALELEARGSVKIELGLLDTLGFDRCDRRPSDCKNELLSFDVNRLSLAFGV